MAPALEVKVATPYMEAVAAVVLPTVALVALAAPLPTAAMALTVPLMATHLPLAPTPVGAVVALKAAIAAEVVKADVSFMSTKL